MPVFLRHRDHLAALAAAVLAAGCAAPPPASPPPADANLRAGVELRAADAPPLPMSQCLDPERARGWVLIDSDELLVDAGRLHYHVRLSMACPELGTTPSIEFRAGGGIGRLCGHPTDAVVPLGQPLGARRCPVSALTLIDEAQYAALAQRKQGTVSRTHTEGAPRR